MILATQLDQPLESVREQLETAGRLNAIRSDMRIRAALQWVTDRAEIVDGMAMRSIVIYLRPTKTTTLITNQRKRK